MSVQLSEPGIFKGFGQGLLRDYPQHEPLGTPLFHSNCVFLAATAFPACENPPFSAELCSFAGSWEGAALRVLKELQCFVPLQGLVKPLLVL